MAASRERALRFSGESGKRPQRKLTRKVIQSINGVERKSGRGRGKNRKCGNVQKVIQRSDERISEGMNGRFSEGISGRHDEGIDERVSEGLNVRIGEGIDDGEVRNGVEQEMETSNETIRCLCACKVESDEMVCCDVCKRCYHLRCIGMKEGVGMMEGKEFVCHYCVSACFLSIKKEAWELREELGSVKSELKEVREENGI